MGWRYAGGGGGGGDGDRGLGTMYHTRKGEGGNAEIILRPGVHVLACSFTRGDHGHSSDGAVRDPLLSHWSLGRSSQFEAPYNRVTTCM